MAYANVVPLDPKVRDTNLPVVTFRAPYALKAWLDQHVAGKVRLANVAVWAVTLGREYYEALKGREDKIEELAARRAVSRGQMVADLLDLGLDAIERKPGKK